MSYLTICRPYASVRYETDCFEVRIKPDGFWAEMITVFLDKTIDGTREYRLTWGAGGMDGSEALSTSARNYASALRHAAKIADKWKIHGKHPPGF